MRDYVILKVREAFEPPRHLVCARSLEEVGVYDVINAFPGTAAGKRAAVAYIHETHVRSRDLERGAGS